MKKEKTSSKDDKKQSKKTGKIKKLIKKKKKADDDYKGVEGLPREGYTELEDAVSTNSSTEESAAEAPSKSPKQTSKFKKHKDIENKVRARNDDSADLDNMIELATRQKGDKTDMDEHNTLTEPEEKKFTKKEMALHYLKNLENLKTLIVLILVLASGITLATKTERQSRMQTVAISYTRPYFLPFDYASSSELIDMKLVLHTMTESSVYIILEEALHTSYHLITHHRLS
eukprot:TRINITY_DN2054_c0_g1_i3.p1 TRINITY_DN2054_c0_g1~~TRINITY_DN2054_c0_g1_i3.p1  ORF type:complete len:230 (-),score=53.24 TRINITY_DN2054_c0_g1_i3:90-779(-)